MMDVPYGVEALEHALSQGQPEIFNTDQGAQFTSQAFTARLKEGGIRISMDGRGRALDHVFVERWWRSVKYEEVVRREAVVTIAALSQHAHEAAGCSISSTLRSAAAR